MDSNKSPFMAIPNRQLEGHKLDAPSLRFIMTPEHIRAPRKNIPDFKTVGEYCVEVWDRPSADLLIDLAALSTVRNTLSVCMRIEAEAELRRRFPGFTLDQIRAGLTTPPCATI